MKRSRIKAVNPERRRRLFARNYGAYADVIREMPCVACGRAAPSEAAHVVARGMGGCGGDRSKLVPLCGYGFGRPGCHELFDEHRDLFTERTGLTREDMAAIASELWEQYGDDDERSDG